MSLLPPNPVYRDIDLNELIYHQSIIAHNVPNELISHQSTNITHNFPNELISHPSTISHNPKRHDWWPASSSHSSPLVVDQLYALLPPDRMISQNPFPDCIGQNLLPPPNLVPPCPSSGSASSYGAALRLSDITAALETLPPGKDDPALPLQTPSILSIINNDFSPRLDLNEILQNKVTDTSWLRKIQPKGPRQNGGRGSKSAKAAANRQKKNMQLLLRQLQRKPITKDKDPTSRRDTHIHSERQRREGMTRLYSTLHSLLPEAKPKTDRCTVLTDTMKCIQTLRKKLVELGRKKADLIPGMGSSHKSFVTSTNKESNVSSGVDGGATEAETDPTQDGPSVEEAEGCGQLRDTAEISVRLFGRDVFITLKGPKKKGLWSGILEVLDEQSFEVLNATLSTSIESDFHCIHAKVPSTFDLQSYNLHGILQKLVIVEPITQPCESG